MVWIRTDYVPAIMPWNLRYQPVEKFDPNQPRDESGKWTATGAGGMSAGSVWSNVMGKPESERGISINYVGAEPSDGYMVAFEGAWQPIPEADFADPAKGKRALADYLKQHAKSLGSSDKTYLGIWFNTETRTYELDLSDNISDRQRAIDVGRKRQQESAWDVVNMDVVFIGARDTDRQMALDNLS